MSERQPKTPRPMPPEHPDGPIELTEEVPKHEFREIIEEDDWLTATPGTPEENRRWFEEFKKEIELAAGNPIYECPRCGPGFLKPHRGGLRCRMCPHIVSAQSMRRLARVSMALQMVTALWVLSVLGACAFALVTFRFWILPLAWVAYKYTPMWPTVPRLAVAPGELELS